MKPESQKILNELQDQIRVSYFNNFTLKNLYDVDGEDHFRILFTSTTLFENMFRLELRHFDKQELQIAIDEFINELKTK